MSITLTMTDILYIAGAITAISAAANWIAKGIRYLMKPNKEQNNNIKDNQELLKKHSDMLVSDNKRLNAVESENRLIMQALLALTQHEIDGNNIQHLKDDRDNIQEYLISK